ncbi:WbqC family protein [Saccharicrinis fermentans]|uniref:WbqC-like protein family protein n=1 Tax=Saccharicrinis fermentans DSM 9555 = JCM 21142 TaxID=869213 RepID=W7YFN7_9BACT|nr:WbqC family protein [Saccharicrinis fermentans]GAF03261.1 WbqC-like protein family protein [Saccharicrinis fermentans DSM 9555 = JCM 21142]
MSCNKIIGIHQPNYLPWLGYFYKIYQSDIFVFLDDVQYSNQGMHNYTYLKTSNGSFRLKFPVNQKHGDRIDMVTSKDQINWKKKHQDTIAMNYKKAPYFEQVYNDYTNILLNDYKDIVALNAAFIQFFSKKLGFKTQFVRSSELGIEASKTEKILGICAALKGDVYYSGTGAKAYQNKEDFDAQGVELRYSVFKPVEYPQLWKDFQSNVSALDFFMNCGYDFSLILKAQEEQKIDQ